MKRLIIATPRHGLTMKQLVPTDAKFYFALVHEDRAHLSQHDDRTAKRYPTLASVRDSIINPRNPKKLRFGIWGRRTFVGMVGLTPRGHGVCETGGWTGKRFCRRGYATVTRRALARYALNHLGYQRVIAKTHPNNIASQRMLKRAGFRLVRRTKKSYYFTFDPR